MRVSSKIKQLKDTHQLQNWELRYHRSVFSWAGHVARMKTYDVNRATYQVMCYRNWRWIRNTTEENDGNQLHGRRLRTWRWERTLYKYFGDSNWEDAALDHDAWSQQLDSMALWRCTHR